MQAKLIAWAVAEEAKIPALRYLFSIPNAGAFFSRKLLLEGIKSGVPDLCLAWPSGKFHSLYIEMKSGSYKLSEDQKKWKRMLEQAGHFVGICRDLEDAKSLLELYIYFPGSLEVLPPLGGRG